MGVARGVTVAAQKRRWRDGGRPQSRAWIRLLGRRALATRRCGALGGQGDTVLQEAGEGNFWNIPSVSDTTGSLVADWVGAERGPSSSSQCPGGIYVLQKKIRPEISFSFFKWREKFSIFSISFFFITKQNKAKTEQGNKQSNERTNKKYIYCMRWSRQEPLTNGLGWV